MKTLDNAVKYGIINFRGTHTYNIPNIGNVIFKTDKNGSVYEIAPRKFALKENSYDLLTMCRGQVPDAAAYTVQEYIAKIIADDLRYNCA